MIRVRAGDLGEFKIVESRFVEGTQEAFNIYKEVMAEEQIGRPQDGPVDLFISSKIAAKANQDMEILDSEFSDSDPNVVY